MEILVRMKKEVLGVKPSASRGPKLNQQPTILWPEDQVGPNQPNIILNLQKLRLHLRVARLISIPRPYSRRPTSDIAVLVSHSVGSGIFLGSPRSVADMSDEEVSDPKALLEDRSKAKCVSQWYEYQKCVKRIEDDETGQKHCTGQYFDYWKCIDKNVAEKLFDSLK
ncbi:uncharacterized protein LOC100828312 [Brachypodium distachyon]|nr:uncharacterized protein LOC100828312 [Brachypodium distachyon]|eukprot:XP_003575101.2 uncharacterized protein LOC100828312 [Brachypodium distachyon]